MSMFSKRGAAAAASATAEKETKDSAIVSFSSGTTYKVRVKSAEDSVEYYAYGIFDKVHTFVPKTPAERNAKGYVVAAATVWDRAEEYLRAQAKAAKDAGREAEAEKIGQTAYLYKGKPRYLVAFGNLEDGADIVIDLSKKQAAGIFATIAKYAKKLDKVAFELSKTGRDTSTSVTLTPILDMDEDLTEQERKNFDKCGAKPFDQEQFEACLFVADDAEQTKFLIQAGFDIGKIGLTYGGGSDAGDDAQPIDDSKPAPSVDF